MTVVVGQPVYAPDPDLDLPFDTQTSNSGFEVLIPTGASQEERHEQLQIAYENILVTLQAEAYSTGNCGYSYVYLDRTNSHDYDAVHEGGFKINRPGYGYRLNVRTWDPDVDTFNLNTPENGNLNGTTRAEVFEYFYVPESDNYRAKLTRGDVYVGSNNWCVTGQPQTTEYLRR